MFSLFMNCSIIVAVHLYTYMYFHLKCSIFTVLSCFSVTKYFDHTGPSSSACLSSQSCSVEQFWQDIHAPDAGHICPKHIVIEK